MTQLPQFLGINDFVDQVARELMAAPLRPAYRSRDTMARHVEQLLSRFLKRWLGPLNLTHRLWRGGIDIERGEWLEPAFVFGTEFTPDIVVDVGDSPTLALHTLPIRQGQAIGSRVASAIGEAVVYSHLYPAVLVLIQRTGEDVEYKHLQDREIMTDLWRSHKIRLLLR